MEDSPRVWCVDVLSHHAPSQSLQCLTIHCRIPSSPRCGCEIFGALVSTLCAYCASKTGRPVSGCDSPIRSPMWLFWWHVWHEPHIRLRETKLFGRCQRVAGASSALAWIAVCLDLKGLEEGRTGDGASGLQRCGLSGAAVLEAMLRPQYDRLKVLGRGSYGQAVLVKEHGRGELRVIKEREVGVWRVEIDLSRLPAAARDQAKNEARPV
eukprot:3398024-Amphidinium_carterae.1